jgi:hypothetical protein
VASEEDLKKLVPMLRVGTKKIYRAKGQKYKRVKGVKGQIAKPQAVSPPATNHQPLTTSH